MMTYLIYFRHPANHVLKLEIKTSGVETAIKQAKEMVENHFEDFVFDGRVTRLYKSWS